MDRPTFRRLARSSGARGLPLQAGEVAEFPMPRWPGWIRMVFALSLICWGVVLLALICAGAVAHG